MSVMCPISLGEFWDKYTISEVKFERVKDRERIANVGREYGVMRAVSQKLPVCKHVRKLKTLNTAIWKVENQIRRCVRKDNYGKDYIESTSMTVQLNDERARLKKQIDIEGGSELVWEKEHV